MRGVGLEKGEGRETTTLDTRVGAKAAPACRATRARTGIGLRERGSPRGSGAGAQQRARGPCGTAPTPRYPVGPSGALRRSPARRGVAGTEQRSETLGRKPGGRRSILRVRSLGPRAPGPGCDPSACTNFAARRRPCPAGESRRLGAPGARSPVVRQPRSLALTYPSSPSGWCPAAPTLCPVAASGRSEGRIALPGRWAARRSRGAPRAPGAPCRPLLRG